MISVPIEKEDMETMVQDFVHIWAYERHELSFWKFSMKIFDLMKEILHKNKIICDTVLLDEKLLKKLESAHFDILISDPVTACGELVAEKLHLPFIYSLRFTFGNTMERLCGGIPSPPSYVPASLGGLTDRMTFLQRMGNMLFYLSQDILFQQYLFKQWDTFYSEVLGKNLFLVAIVMVLASTTIFLSYDFYICDEWEIVGVQGQTNRSGGWEIGCVKGQASGQVGGERFKNVFICLFVCLFD